MEFFEQSPGTLSAISNGFEYHYNMQMRGLNVGLTDSNRVLTQFDLGHNTCQDPRIYIRYMDKALQLKALRFSNNQTNDLLSIIHERQIPAMLRLSGITSQLACNLHYERFCRFAEIFCEEYDLKYIKIKKFSSRNNDEFFIARILTHHDNGIVVRGCTLAGLTAALSDKTLRDLVALEFGYRFEHSAQSLLKVSTKLAALSCILDDEFRPEEKVQKIKNGDAWIIHSGTGESH